MTHPSLNMWEETAVPAQHYPPHSGDLKVDCAIIGGGYTGLSAALHLAERGQSVCVLEAQQVGWGGSGRNAGAVVPAWPLAAPEDLVKTYGEADAAAMNQLVMAAARELLPGLIARFDMACDWRPDGSLITARSQKKFAAFKTMAAQWAQLGASIDVLNKNDLSEYVTDRTLTGGLLYRHGGALNPLSFVREMARAAAGLGATICENTAALGLARSGDAWDVQTAKGMVRARQVIIATNAYSAGLMTDLDKSFVPVPLAMFATDPIPDLQAAICPGGLPYYDDDPVTPFQIRFDSEGRLFSGGYPVKRQEGDPQALAAQFQRHFAKRFPDLQLPTFTYAWQGMLCVSADFLPKVYNPARGLWAAMGYSGSGVSMATALGKDVALRVAGDDARWPVSRLKGFPMRRLTHFAATKLLPAYARIFSAT